MSETTHAKVPGSETSENGYLGACACQPRGGAWPCRNAPAPALTAVLDELDELRTKATPGRLVVSPWDDKCLLPEAWANEADPPVERGPFVSVVASNPADAACIVAEHNAVPQLTAALRAVLELHRPDPVAAPWGQVCMTCIGAYEEQAAWPCSTFAAITTALEATP